jgi:hypothetical protein
VKRPDENKEHKTSNRCAIPGLWAKVCHRAVLHNRCCNCEDYQTKAEKHGQGRPSR